MNSPPLVPAKAGTQSWDWIPACAGMSGKRADSPLLVEAPPDRAGVVAARTLAGEIAGGELGLDLHACVRRNHVVGQRHAFVDGDALADEHIALHVAPRGDTMDTGDVDTIP